MVLDPAPKRLGVPISFFVFVPLAEESERFVAYDNDGDRLGCWTIKSGVDSYSGPADDAVGSGESAVERGC